MKNAVFREFVRETIANGSMKKWILLMSFYDPLLIVHAIFPLMNEVNPLSVPDVVDALSPTVYQYKRVFDESRKPVHIDPRWLFRALVCMVAYSRQNDIENVRLKSIVIPQDMLILFEDWKDSDVGRRIKNILNALIMKPTAKPRRDFDSKCMDKNGFNASACPKSKEILRKMLCTFVMADTTGEAAAYILFLAGVGPKPNSYDVTKSLYDNLKPRIRTPGHRPEEIVLGLGLESPAMLTYDQVFQCFLVKILCDIMRFGEDYMTKGDPFLATHMYQCFRDDTRRQPIFLIKLAERLKTIPSLSKFKKEVQKRKSFRSIVELIQWPVVRFAITEMGTIKLDRGGKRPWIRSHSSTK
jgi:hypothetical protein